MSYASRVTYTGDAVTKQFNVPFPYLSQTHVQVYVNETLMLNPGDYTWSGPSTIQFGTAPALNAAIQINRWTSPSNILVDFVDGSTLRANDLDTAYLHNFYLSQEYTDSYNNAINNILVQLATDTGIVETETDLIINALVAEMLSDAAAAELQQRVNDIDANAEAIVTLGEALQVQINTLATGVAANVYIQPNEPIPGVGGIPNPILEGSRWYDSDDNNAPYIYQSGAWVSIQDPRIGQAVADISVLQTDVAGNTAAIVAESVARSNADSAFASTLALIGAQNGGGTAFIIDLNTVQITDGVESLADRFNTIQAQITANDGDIATNAAAITTEQTARVNGDSANAANITALDARVTTAEGNIVANANAITTTNTNVSTNAGNISTNASNITALQTTVNLRNRTFSASSAPTASNAGDLWIDTANGNKLYRWTGAAWVSIQDAAIAGNASAISALDADLTTAEGNITANASSITSLSASVTTLTGRVDTAEVDITANASAITSAEGDITALEARYGVKLAVNNYITGFLQNNDGTTGNFVVMADNFAIVTPQQAWAASTAYALEKTIRPTVHNGRVYECTTAGTSSSTEPTWSTTLGATIADGTVVWTCRDDSQYTPFIVSGDRVRFNTDVEINGNLILNGTVVGSALVAGTIGSTQIGTNAITTDKINANAITAAKIAANTITADKLVATNLSGIFADLGTITAGTITLNTSGWIKGGQTAFNTGTGFFLGYESSAYKFSIGNPSVGNYLTWDGSTLTIKGNLFVGVYVASNTVLLSANTERSQSFDGFVEKKAFQVDRAGTVRVKFEVRRTGTGDNLHAYRVLRGSTIVADVGITSTSYYAVQHDVSGVTADEIVSVQIQGSSGPPGERTSYIRNCTLCADVTIPAAGGTVTND